MAGPSRSARNAGELGLHRCVPGWAGFCRDQIEIREPVPARAAGMGVDEVRVHGDHWLVMPEQGSPCWPGQTVLAAETVLTPARNLKVDCCLSTSALWYPSIPREARLSNKNHRQIRFLSALQPSQTQ